MKSLFDLKHDLGKIVAESADDLYILSDIIIPGCMVTAKTLRGVEIRRGEEKVKVGKKFVTLTIIVEKVELTEKLRLGGRIVEAPSEIEHKYHTIEVEPGTFLKIQKKWRSWEINKIKSAERKAEPVLICILDEMEADFYLLKERAKHLFHLSSPGLRKEEKVKTSEYYGNVVSEIKNREALGKKIVVAGPGFAREEVLKLIKQRAREIYDKIIIDSLNHTGNVGLQELFNKGILARIVKESRISEETKIIEEFLTEIARDGKIVYGLEETEKAVDSGAIELLLVSDKKVREFEDLLEKAEKIRSKVMIISSEHPSGEKFLGLGGIGGFLRYKI